MMKVWVCSTLLRKKPNPLSISEIKATKKKKGKKNPNAAPASLRSFLVLLHNLQLQRPKEEQSAHTPINLIIFSTSRKSSPDSPFAGTYIDMHHLSLLFLSLSLLLKFLKTKINQSLYYQSIIRVCFISLSLSFFSPPPFKVCCFH